MSVTVCKIDENGVRHYPQTIIWKRGVAVDSSQRTEALVRYPSRVERVLWRTLHDGRVIATFHWSDQAWSCVCFESERAFGALMNAGSTYHNWPAAESLL